MNAKAMRASLGFSCSEWARILGVTDRTLYRWEAGAEPTGMHLSVLSAISLALKKADAEVVRSRLLLGIGPMILSALTEVAHGKVRR